MVRLFAIARNAFVEMVRQPIYGVLILVTFAALVLDVPLASWTMGGDTAEYKKTDQQFLVNLGLSSLLVSGLLIAAFGAAGVVSREIRDRTILTVVSKPLPRALVVVGKFVGVAAAVTVAYWLCSTAFLMTVRHGVRSAVSDPWDVPVLVLGLSALGATLIAALVVNYVFGWHFVSSAVGFGVALLTPAMVAIGFIGKGWRLVSFGAGLAHSLPEAMVLMLFSSLVLAAVAVAASTRLGQATTLLACVAFFVAGIWGSYLFSGLPAGAWGGRVLERAMPNLTYFYALDALIQEKTIPWHYVGLAGAYAACQIVAVLAVGAALFETRELETTSSGAPQGVAALAVIGRLAAVPLVVAALAAALGGGGVRAWLDAGGLLAAAVINWLFWGWVGRGVRWTYVVLALVGAAALHLAAAGLLGVTAASRLSRPALIGAAVAAAAVLLVLALPKSRHHFNLIRSSRRRRGR